MRRRREPRPERAEPELVPLPGGASAFAPYAISWKAGRFFRLDDLVDGGWRLPVALAVNDSGQILASAANGQTVLLTPR